MSHYPLVGVWVFLISLLIYLTLGLGVTYSGINTLILQSEDFLPVATVPFSILNEGNLIQLMSMIGGALIVAMSTGIFYLVLRKLTTNTLSISSQGLWQQTSSQLLLSLGMPFSNI